MIYGNDGYCYAINGVVVGNEATPVPPPPPTTSYLYLSAQNGYPISASAYKDGVLVTSWNANGGSASANIEFNSGDDVYVVVKERRKEGYTAGISSNIGTPLTPGSSDSTSTTFGNLVIPYGTTSGMIVGTPSAAKFIVSGEGYIFKPWSGDLSPSYPYYETGTDYNGVLHLTYSQANALEQMAPGVTWRAVPDSATGDSTYVATHRYSLKPSMFVNLYIHAGISAKMRAYDVDDYVEFYLEQSSKYAKNGSSRSMDGYVQHINAHQEIGYQYYSCGGSAECAASYNQGFSFNFDTRNPMNFWVQVYGNGTWGFSGQVR